MRVLEGVERGMEGVEEEDVEDRGSRWGGDIHVR